MTKLTRVFLAIALLTTAGACAKRVKKAESPKAAPRTPTAKALSATALQKWKVAELARLSDKLEPVWSKTVLRERDRDKACKQVLEIDEAARKLAYAELPKALEAKRIEFDQRVGELRAAIIIFAAECSAKEQGAVASSFTPIPTAFDAVKQVVGVDETRQVSARLAPQPKPSVSSPGAPTRGQ